MYFGDEDDARLIPDGYQQALRRQLYAITSSVDAAFIGLRSVPTHTEDGIPIRKLYVSNLPPKAKRTEIFAVFAQYGFIKSCWLRMGDKGPNRIPAPAYAFVTFSNPADAHKALQAPLHEKTLRGRTLRISPADSWHQPAVETDGRVRWKPLAHRQNEENNPDMNGDQQVNVEEQPEGIKATSDEINNTRNGEEFDVEQPYNVLDILNRDCLMHVLNYVPIRDVIRSERVSRRWQDMVQEYLDNFRVFKTSWWQHSMVPLTTAVLRHVLQRLGAGLLRLHIDHHWSALNDRTAHTVGKFCPVLEEIKVVGMHTKNWNPLVYGCKQLKSLSFVSCNKLTDSSLVHLVKHESCLESLTIANNTHVTGLFLTGSNPTSLSSLAFYNCYSLQGTVLSTAIDSLPHLTTLKLDVCPVTMWKIVPLILNKLPKLEELSLSEYMSMEIIMAPIENESFCKSLAKLTELKVLNLNRNIYITNAVLKQVAQSCPKLISLNISSCNSRKSFPHPGVGDEGIEAICSGCSALERLDVSYLAALSDDGLAAAARLRCLTELIARGNPALTAASFASVLSSCSRVQEIDACGCDSVSDELVAAAECVLATQPRELVLRLASTAAAGAVFLEAELGKPEYPEWMQSWRTHEAAPGRGAGGAGGAGHPLLRVNLHEDRSNPHLRPDFVDRILDESSDDSYDDLYDHEDFDDIVVSDDDDLFFDDEMENYDVVLACGMQAPIMML